MILRAIYGDPHHHIGLTEAKQAIGVTSETMELETSGRVLCLLRRFAVQEARGSKAQSGPVVRIEASSIKTQRAFSYYCWLVLYLHPWKIWKSVGMIIPNIYIYI